MLLLARLPQVSARAVAAAAIAAGAIWTARGYAYTAPRALLDAELPVCRAVAGQGRLVVDGVLRQQMGQAAGSGEGVSSSLDAYTKALARARATLTYYGGEAPVTRLVGGYPETFLWHDLRLYLNREGFRRADQLWPLVGVGAYLGPNRPLPARLARLFEAKTEVMPSGALLRRTAERPALVRCVGRAEGSADPVARLAEEPAFDAREVALVEPASAPMVGSTGALEVSDEGPGRWRARVRTEAGCLLVVAENDDPGWVAEIDGRPVDTERVYGAFVGVRVPAGAHEVLVRHKAPAPLAHLPGLAFALGVLWVLRRRLRPSPRQNGPRG